MQGEGGVNPATPGFLAAAAELAAEHGALLCFDEVQTGVGRTGSFFAFEQLGVRPHLVTLAKGLANGLPIGALLAADDAPAGLEPGDHASTFGGNPVVCAAACAVVETVDEELLANVRERSAQLAEALPVRGAGLLLGLETPARRTPSPAASTRACSSPRPARRRSVSRPRSPSPPDEVAQAISILQEVLLVTAAPPRAPGRDPAPDPRAPDLDPGRARRRAPRRGLRGRADDRLARHRRARARQGARGERPARLRAAGRRRPRPAAASSSPRSAAGRSRSRRATPSSSSSRPRGFAAALADAIDESNHPKVLATVAGENTILVVPAAGVRADALREELNSHLLEGVA